MSNSAIARRSVARPLPPGRRGRLAALEGPQGGDLVFEERRRIEGRVEHAVCLDQRLPQRRRGATEDHRAARAGRLDAPSEPIPCLRSQFSSSSTGNIWKFKGLNGVVWEWVWDVKASYTSQPRVDTVWPTPGRERVLRGGSFASPDLECAFTARNAAGLESRTEDLGFRLARTE